MSRESLGPSIQPGNERPPTIDLVPNVFYNLQEFEFGKKPIPAAEELIARLQELAQGRLVPLVVFNCLDFTWKPNKSKYPQSTVFGYANTSICRYSQDEIEIIKLELETLGSPNLRIIVPDSELFDDRVFSFAQSKEEMAVW